MEEIARRSGVSVPVLYDHFTSKQDLHRHLLVRHFAELRALWTDRLASPQPASQRIGVAVDAWFEYVETHPYAWGMLFADTTGDPDIYAMHQEVAAASRDALLPLLAQELDVEASPSLEVEMLWEAIRGVLQGLARWWFQHQGTPRREVVETALATFWDGLRWRHEIIAKTKRPTPGASLKNRPT